MYVIAQEQAQANQDAKQHQAMILTQLSQCSGVPKNITVGGSGASTTTGSSTISSTIASGAPGAPFRPTGSTFLPIEPFHLSTTWTDHNLRQCQGLFIVLPGCSKSEYGYYKTAPDMLQMDFKFPGELTVDGVLTIFKWANKDGHIEEGGGHDAHSHRKQAFKNLLAKYQTGCGDLIIHSWTFKLKFAVEAQPVYSKLVKFKEDHQFLCFEYLAKDFHEQGRGDDLINNDSPSDTSSITTVEEVQHSRKSVKKGGGSGKKLKKLK